MNKAILMMAVVAWAPVYMLRAEEMVGEVGSQPAPGVEMMSEYDKLNVQALDAIQEGETVNAFKVLNKALRLDPTRVEAYENFGLAHIRREEWRSAEMALNKALEVDPESHRAWALLADVYLHGPEPGAALTALEQAIRLSEEPQWRYHFKLARLSDAAGLKSDAAAAYEDTISALQYEIAEVDRLINTEMKKTVATRIGTGTEIQTRFGGETVEVPVTNFETRLAEAPEELKEFRNELVGRIEECRKLKAQL